jgi:hypothetical protein
MTTPAPADLLARVRAWCQVSSTSLSDDQLTLIIAAELALQASVATLAASAPAYPPELEQALYRRCARQIAARGLPLGQLGDAAEYGPLRLAGFDAEIERLEDPYVPVVVA